MTIGITNQRETLVAWDKYTGEPFYNAIVWSDGRTEAIAKQFKEQWAHSEDQFKMKSGKFK